MRRLCARTAALHNHIRAFHSRESVGAMQRVTITIDDDLTAELERYMAMRGYANRPEAIRYLARAGLQQNSAQVCGPGQCVAALIYVYDHNQRELPKRLT